MKILIGAPVRQDEKIFKEYLESLNNLLIPEGAEVDAYFILNDCPELEKYLEPDQFETLNTGDVYTVNEETHIWTTDNLNKMSTLRNRLLEKTLNGGYDYLFMVDTDLILHPNTLIQLLSSKKKLIANIFWTQEKPNSNYFWANCWDYDQYTQVNVKEWLRKGVYEVGGTGACFLISREVIEKGVNYSPISNLKFIHGEDRYFCIRAVCNGFKIYIDTHYPALHLYRPSIYEDYIKSKAGGLNGFNR